MPRQTPHFDPRYTVRIEACLNADGHSLRDSAKVAGCVLRLSDHYLKHPLAPTPWHEPWARVAYAAYFFPLNYLRVAAVAREGGALGFYAGINRALDFGAGPGTALLAVVDHAPELAWRGVDAVERAAAPERLYDRLAGPERRPPVHWHRQTPELKPASDLLGIFSFSLTELSAPPAWIRACGALMLVEPATNQDGRRLLRWRDELMAAGYRVVGPCTHQGVCPLLAESERDWCHDRVVCQMPDWFQELSRHLPMRNSTLTMSWLLLRREPAHAATAAAGMARLTGDAQRFKGVTRQMVCRGQGREFLAWQHRDGDPPDLPRGARIRLPADIAVKGRELRPRPGEIEEL